MIRSMLVKELWDLRGVLAISTLGYLYWLFLFTCMPLPEWRSFQNSYGLLFKPYGCIQSMIAYGCAVAAFLGLFQGLADAPSPRLQFVLAQPISWTQLLLAKVAIGLGVWVAGCLGTLIAAALLSIFLPIYPGFLESWMLTDSVSWLAMGTTIYLGAFLSAIRPALWIGTRLFPLFGAIGLWYFVLLPLSINQFKFAKSFSSNITQIAFWIIFILSTTVQFLSIIFMSEQLRECRASHFRGFLANVLKSAAGLGLAFFLSIGFFSIIALGCSTLVDSLPRELREISDIHARHERPPWFLQLEARQKEHSFWNLFLHLNPVAQVYLAGYSIQRDFHSTAVGSLFFMAICFWRERRYGATWSETIGWLGFVGLSGVSGWFGYRFHKQWPLFVRCPSCSQKRPVSKDLCPHCHVGFAPAAPAVTPNIKPTPVSTTLEPQIV